MAKTRVAMVGTPDAANFGDVLFPVIASHELRERLGNVELTAYGYRNVSAEHWPYPVRSLGALPAEISRYDLLLIGGGHIVRDDFDVAPGYTPSDRRVHRPLGLWLVPALLGIGAGVPVAWNAVGVSPALDPWLEPLVRAAVAGSQYVAVRDDPSAEALAAFAPEAEICVVPDTALGAPALVDEEAERGARDLLATAGIGDRGYVIVQATSGLSAVRDAVEDVVRAARRRELAVLELPVGPVLGDAVGALELPGPIATLERWPSPKEFTALISGAEAIIHQSLHAGLVGFAAGVGCLRRPTPPGWKHDQLNGLPGVHLLGQNGAIDVILGRRNGPDPSAETVRQLIRGRLASHWDVVAGLVGRGNRRQRRALLELLASLPGELATTGARMAAQEDALDAAAEYEAAYRAFAHRTEELQSEARMHGHAPELAAELDYLRQRDATLQRVFDGGWWKLRDRLLPILRLAGRSREPVGLRPPTAAASVSNAPGPDRFPH